MTTMEDIKLPKFNIEYHLKNPIPLENIVTTLSAEILLFERTTNFKDIKEYFAYFDVEAPVIVEGDTTISDKLFPDVVAEENFLGNFFRGIINTLLHLINNFKTVVFKMFKDFKRTELQQYHDNYKLTVNEILRSDFNTIKDVEIDIPQGLKTTYFRACNSGISLLDFMNMKERSTSFLFKMKNIHTSITSGSSIDLNDFNLVSDLNPIKDLFKSFTRNFNSSDKTKKVRFSEVFEEHDLPKVDTVLLGYYKHAVEVSGIYDDMTTMNELISGMVNHLTNVENTMSKKDLVVFQKSVLLLAVMFDMYGTTLQDMFRVEHNFVHVLKTIRTVRGL